MDAAVKLKSVKRGPSPNKWINLTCYSGLPSSGFAFSVISNLLTLFHHTANSYAAAFASRRFFFAMCCADLT